jgi:hypothetical protein
VRAAFLIDVFAFHRRHASELAFLGEQFCYNDIKRLNLRGKKQKK